MTNTDNDAQAKLAEHRDQLEEIAESDLKINWVARQLLEAVDE